MLRVWFIFYQPYILPEQSTSFQSNEGNFSQILKYFKFWSSWNLCMKTLRNIYKKIFHVDWIEHLRSQANKKKFRTFQYGIIIKSLFGFHFRCFILLSALEKYCRIILFNKISYTDGANLLFFKKMEEFISLANRI